MIDDLLRICDIESDPKEVGWAKRRKAVLDWYSKNVHFVIKELSVIDAKVFDSENMDMIKEQLAKQIAEDLTTYTAYEIKKNKIKATVVALKKPAK